MAQLSGTHEEPQYAPIPYQFAYKAESEEGSHGHSENSDGNGNAQGEYFIKLADGRQRNVRYTADANGFVAEIETNEFGTESKDAADAKYSSSAPTGAEASIQFTADQPPAPRRLSTVPAPRIVRVAAPATVIRTTHAAPVIRTVTTSAHPITVVKTARAPALIKTVRTTPVRLTVAHPDGDVHHVIH